MLATCPLRWMVLILSRLLLSRIWGILHSYFPSNQFPDGCRSVPRVTLDPMVQNNLRDFGQCEPSFFTTLIRLSSKTPVASGCFPLVLQNGQLDGSLRSFMIQEFLKLLLTNLLVTNFPMNVDHPPRIPTNGR
jgi:hypothetical protein